MNTNIPPILLALVSVRGQQDTGASPSLGAVTGMVTGLMKVLGYDDQRLSSMAVNMALYVGELTANSLLDVDNNIDTEMSEYRSFSQSGDIFSLIKLAVMRSTSRGEEIKSTLLDEELPTRMIERLEASAGERSDCIQLFLCKMSPVIAAIQQSASEATSEMFGNSLEYTSNLMVDLAYGKFPDQVEFEINSRKCEAQYNTCKLSNE